MNESPKLFRSSDFLRHQLLVNLKKSVFDFLLCLPTTFFAFLLLFFLTYNVFSIFFYLPSSFPAKTPPGQATFSPETTARASLPKCPPSSSSSSSSSPLNLASQKINTNFPILQELNFPTQPVIDFTRKIPRGPQKPKRTLISLPTQAKDHNFSARILEFFSMNSSSSSDDDDSCKVRFFMTWISSSELFSDKEILAVESLFKSHPNACLVIVSNSMDSIPGRKILSPFSINGFRVVAITPDFNYIFKNTYAETWFDQLRKGNVDLGVISIDQNLSNLLRLVLLYKFGGIYIDTDVIVLKSLSNLRNVIGAQTVDVNGNWSRLNNAVLIFDKKHPLLFRFIQEFALTFNGYKWGHNGPYLVSRVLSRLIDRGLPGFDFTVLPPSSFYPVDWNKIQGLFEGPRDEFHSRWLVKKLKQIESRSLALHLWNRNSRNLEVEKGSIMDHIRLSCCLFCNFTQNNIL